MREIENWKKFERKFGLTTNKKLLFENYYKFKKMENSKFGCFYFFHGKCKDTHYLRSLTFLAVNAFFTRVRTEVPLHVPLAHPQ